MSSSWTTRHQTQYISPVLLYSCLNRTVSRCFLNGPFVVCPFISDRRSFENFGHTLCRDLAAYRLTGRDSSSFQRTREAWLTLEQSTELLQASRCCGRVIGFHPVDGCLSVIVCQTWRRRSWRSTGMKCSLWATTTRSLTVLLVYNHLRMDLCDCCSGRKQWQSKADRSVQLMASGRGFLCELEKWSQRKSRGNTGYSAILAWPLRVRRRYTRTIIVWCSPSSLKAYDSMWCRSQMRGDTCHHQIWAHILILLQSESAESPVESDIPFVFSLKAFSYCTQ